MRVIVPYTRITRGCDECLCRHCPHAERVYVCGDDPCAYWRLMCRVWADGEDFLLVEHDAEFDERAVRTLEQCPEPFCRGDGGFRFVRFRAELIRARPDAFTGIPMSGRHWLVLAGFASERLGGWHSHIIGLGVVNGRSDDSEIDKARAAAWYAWLRGLPPEHADSRTAAAWAAIHCNPDGSDDGLPCSRKGCKRTGGLAGASCSRCAHDPPPAYVVDIHTGRAMDPRTGRLAVGNEPWAPRPSAAQTTQRGG